MRALCYVGCQVTVSKHLVLSSSWIDCSLRYFTLYSFWNQFILSFDIFFIIIMGLARIWSTSGHDKNIFFFSNFHFSLLKVSSTFAEFISIFSSQFGFPGYPNDYYLYFWTIFYLILENRIVQRIFDLIFFLFYKNQIAETVWFLIVSYQHYFVMDSKSMFHQLSYGILIS